LICFGNDARKGKGLLSEENFAASFHLFEKFGERGLLAIYLNRFHWEYATGEEVIGQALGYLLDSSVCVPILRNQTGLNILPNPAHVAIPMIVAAELWTGVDKNRKTHRQHVARLEAFLALFPIIDLTIADARCYAVIRATLEQKGQSIGPLDLFIAAQARRLNLTLVTGHITEFKRVTGLKLLHWK
jgi:tRNA(fMet)-specific endonuclease VapC